MSQPSERLLARMGEFVRTIGAGLSAPQRRRFAEYAQGLLLPGERKSMEPLAARLDPEHAMARYKTFQRFISVSHWDDHAVRRAGFRWAEGALLRGKPPLAWLVDDTGFPKQGKHSVFVQRQYSGTLGKVGNCQVAVSLSVCTESQSLPLDFELYMPEKWAKDRGRRKACKVPTGLKFRTKPEIALDMIDAAVRDGIPVGPVVADSAYGEDSAFRETLDLLGLYYMVGVHGPTTVYTPAGLASDKAWMSVLDVGKALGRRAFKTVSWREGTKGKLESEFVALRVHARRDGGAVFRSEDEQDLWLLMEWPKDETEPTKFSFSNRPASAAIADLVFLAKCRNWIERDYQDLKGELGLDHFEGRSYIGWHHHVSMCLAAYAFLLTLQSEAFPPGASCLLEALAPPLSSRAPRPRGAAAAA
jgi:SRSO17 transposase